jgi:hypothetical protein
LLLPLGAQAQDAMFLSSDGYVGIGTDTPSRQLHLSGANAAFRMDRSVNTAAFLLTRTTASGTPLKTFVVGTNASGSNNGEFIINDLGTAVTGGGTRRMTIKNNGDAIFTGSVTAEDFFTPSSRQFKDEVEPISDALAVVQQLQGVHFMWKDSRRPAVGLIAEDVAKVLPEVVQTDAESGQPGGVNYSALVSVLVEAVKEQQKEVATLEAALDDARQRAAEQDARFSALERRLASIEQLSGYVPAEPQEVGGSGPVVAEAGRP